MLKVPMIAEAIEAKRMADCALLGGLPKVVNIALARMTGEADYAGRLYEQPTQAEWPKHMSGLKTYIESAVNGVSTSSKDAGEIDGAGLVARLRAVVEQGEAELQRIEAVAAARAKPVVAPIEIDEADVFG